MWAEFEEYLDYLTFEKESSEATVQKRETNLEQFQDWLIGEGVGSVQEVTRRNLTNYVDHLVDEGYSRNTIVQSKYSTVAAALRFLHRERTIEECPPDRIELSSIKRKARDSMDLSEKKEQGGPKDHLSKSEVYELAEEHVPDPADRNELLVKLMFWTGVRVSELVRVEIGADGTLNGDGSDVDPERPAIRIYRPKADESGVVSYPRDEINPLLRDWVNHGRLRYKCADDTDRLMIGAKGPLRPTRIGEIIDEAARSMGLQEVSRVSADGREYKRVTPHILRHSHAMHFHNEEGVPLDTLKDHLGHSSVSITEDHYASGTAEKMVDTFGE